MNLNKFIGLDNRKKTASGLELSHAEYYERVINGLGWEEVVKFLPRPVEELVKAFEEDEWLNNIPLHQWDSAGISLSQLLRRNGVTTFSKSQLVCILKEYVRQVARFEKAVAKNEKGVHEHDEN